MNELILALVVFLVLFGPPIVIAARREAMENKDRERRREMLFELERRKEIESEKEREGVWVQELLFKVHKSLEKQKARAYGPWITACLRRPETPPGVALEALRRVRGELNGPYNRHFDLNELGRAILALEVATGEWG